MQDTVVENSRILVLKSKFFLVRVIIYFSFLLIPILVPKSVNFTPALHTFIMALYVLFILSQWFMLGKEIDHRLKIYFRVNSSIDRVVYRLFMGMCVFSIYFNIIGLLPHKWIYNLFWVTWILLGLFYSWPTRGKIIRESVTSNFIEFKYLDPFEKTLVFLIMLMFVFSIPELPILTDIEALKLFFDNRESFSPLLWKFFTVNYYPFFKYPNLFKVAWCMHFYCIGIGFFLLTFYSLLRYFLSRRVSLLGIFALLSSWTFSKLLAAQHGFSISTTYSLVWIWSILWVSKSTTYRSGLLLGLVGYLGALLNPAYGILLFVQLLILKILFSKDTTAWFRKQFFKYTRLGVVLTILIMVTHDGIFENTIPLTLGYFSESWEVISRKAFNVLAIFGLAILLIKGFLPNTGGIKEFQVNIGKVKFMGILILILFIYAYFIEVELIRGFSIMWPVTLLSLIPLELLFQSISRLRSSRNLIYLTYILICILDSHFELRVRTFLKLFS